MHSSSGRTASTTSLSPPTMIDRAAFLAPTSPPDTGASTLPTPFALAAWWISIANDGKKDTGPFRPRLGRIRPGSPRLDQRLRLVLGAVIDRGLKALGHEMLT